MTQRSYLFFVFINTFINSLLWVLTLLYINPEKSGIMGLVFFYASLFFALFGIIYFLSYFSHAKFFKWTSVSKNIQVSTRQSLLFSSLFIGCLILQAQNLLTWYNVLLFIVILTLVEFLFISRKKSYGKPVE
jgi:hypothetical protein